ncbi:MAG: hypothetical protein RQ833_03960 [Sphingomonadaceae bacterium]|nr:hypothetical protein [Sphingomonadaceae bacterium]
MTTWPAAHLIAMACSGRNERSDRLFADGPIVRCTPAGKLGEKGSGGAPATKRRRSRRSKHIMATCVRLPNLARYHLNARER